MVLVEDTSHGIRTTQVEVDALLEALALLGASGWELWVDRASSDSSASEADRQLLFKRKLGQPASKTASHALAQSRRARKAREEQRLAERKVREAQEAEERKARAAREAEERRARDEREAEERRARAVQEARQQELQRSEEAARRATASKQEAVSGRRRYEANAEKVQAQVEVGRALLDQIQRHARTSSITSRSPRPRPKRD